MCILHTIHSNFGRIFLNQNQSYTGMNVFRKGMNSFRNGIRNFSGSKNLKEFFQNSNFLDLVWFGMSFLKPWNFEKILSDSYSLKNFWFFGSFGFPEFQYLSGMFSFRFGTYSFRSGMNSYLSGIHSFRFNFSHSEKGFQRMANKKYFWPLLANFLLTIFEY